MKRSLTWPVPIKRAGVVVSVDVAGGVAVDFAVDGQVTVSGNGDPLGGDGWVVVDGLSVRVRAGEHLGEHATARRSVPLLCPDVFRSW